MSLANTNFIERVRQIHQALKIPDSFASERQLPLHIEADELVEVHCEGVEKTHKLIQSAANAWAEMETAAMKDGIKLILVSTFRSMEYQRALIEKKLQRGEDILKILTLLAPPGYSEHHSGRAIDLTTENCPPCVERFEDTGAFTWLNRNARNFGFRLSYPRDNPYGFVYEPWHWAHST